MGKYKYLIIHCADTFPGLAVSKEVLDEWHKGPRDESDGTVVYLGKKFPDRDSLPNDYLNGKLVKTISGRGWDRYGYREIIHREGHVEIITPFVDDDIITNSEMTWGATGINSESVHLCLEGGRLNKKIPLRGAEKMLFTLPQLIALNDIILLETANHPDIKIAGHNQFTNTKTCPNFDVPAYLRNIGKESFIFKKVKT